MDWIEALFICIKYSTGFGDSFILTGMEEKFRNFIKVTKILNKKGIVPVLYGSLGLYQIIGERGSVNDIDFLIPEVWLEEKWHEFKKYLESHQFRMDDEHEHEFSHPNIGGWIAFGSIEESRTYSGLKVEELTSVIFDGANYLTLNADQFLASYKKSLEDSYRQNKKNKTDVEKIKAIEEHIKNLN